MSEQPEKDVLRDIWHARSQTDLSRFGGPGKTCRAMRHVGTEPVDDALRVAWRERLVREGKSGPPAVGQ